MIDSEFRRKIEEYLRREFIQERVLSSPFDLDLTVSCLETKPPYPSSPERKKKARSKRCLEDAIAQAEEPFSPCLFRLIRERDLSEVEVYTRAGMDRRLFSKIRSRDDYRPGKNTVIALSLAMELSLDETLDLLNRAGFTLSRSNRSDLIVQFMIQEGIFDLFQVNEALDSFGENLLN